MKATSSQLSREMESWKGNVAKGKVVCSVLHSRIGKRIHSLTTECAVLLYHLSKFPPCLQSDTMDHSKQKQFLAVDSRCSSLLPLYHWQHVFSTCLVRLVRMKIQNDQMIKKGVTKSTIYNYMVIQALKWQFIYFGSLVLENSKRLQTVTVCVWGMLKGSIRPY